MSHEDLLARVEAYYRGRLEAHGPTAEGVDWSSAESQRLRFDQLGHLWPQSGRFSVVDYGCGYGALLGYLRDRSGRDAVYRGFDISAAMVEEARKLWAGDPDGVFFVDEDAVPAADYAVASGIFNVKLETEDEAWKEYVLDTLPRLDAKGTRGFAFNALSLYSDPEKRRPQLHYADALFLFDHCKKRFSPRVALLHDYPLYEFTILVRK